MAYTTNVLSIPDIKVNLITKRTVILTNYNLYRKLNENQQLKQFDYQNFLLTLNIILFIKLLLTVSIKS